MRPGFDEALRQGRLIFDGPMGTELLARGHRPPLEELNADAPASVRELHRAYAAAGAQVLRANTLLARRGRVGDPVRLNRLALALAREEAPPGAWVGASIGAPFAKPATRGGASLAGFREAVEEQAQALADADFITLETFRDPDELGGALAAARAAYPGPLLAFCTLRSDLPTRLDAMSTQRVYMTLARFLDAAAPHAVAAVGLNCVPPGGLLELARDFLARESAWSWGILPATARASAGSGRRAAPAALARPAVTTAEDHADVVAACEAALASGAAFVGACCGGTPETIRRLARLLEAPLQRAGDRPSRRGAVRAPRKPHRPPGPGGKPRPPSGRRPPPRPGSRPG